MADEEKTGQTTSTVTDSGVPDAFAKADEAITAESEKQPPAGAVDTEDTEVSETETETGVPAGTGTETEQAAEITETLNTIDEDVLDVMRDFYDDNQIVELSKSNPELLEAIREELDTMQEPPKKEPEPPAKPPEKTAEQELEELKFELDPDLVRPEVKDAFDALAAKVNEYGKKLAEQGKGLDEEKAALQAQKDEAFNNRIDSCFDRHAKQLAAEAKKAGGNPVLELGASASFEGKEFKQLSRPERRQVKLRQEIFRHAQVTSEIRRIPIEKAIELEIVRFKNQDGEKAAEQRLLNKLEKEKTTHTNPPTRRLSKTQPQFADEAEAAEYRMKKAEEEAGLVQ